MKQMKYIIVDDGMSDVPYIFPEHIEHTLMAGLVHGTAISAGFISFSIDSLVCYGKSISLDIESQPEDSDLINKLIGAKHDHN